MVGRLWLGGGMGVAFGVMNIVGVLLWKLGVPVWGLLGMFAICILAATWGGMRVEKIVVHVSRGHFCSECGYNLRGVRSETCPECGRTFTVPHALPLAEPVGGDGAEPRG